MHAHVYQTAYLPIEISNHLMVNQQHRKGAQPLKPLDLYCSLVITCCPLSTCSFVAIIDLAGTATG